ncbi:hypothetical protein ACJJTC_013033 [Scirpophaga incertulas]
MVIGVALLRVVVWSAADLVGGTWYDALLHAVASPRYKKIVEICFALEAEIAHKNNTSVKSPFILGNYVINWLVEYYHRLKGTRCQQVTIAVLAVELPSGRNIESKSLMRGHSRSDDQS